MSCRKVMAGFRQLTKEQEGRMVAMAGVADHSSKPLQAFVVLGQGVC